MAKKQMWEEGAEYIIGKERDKANAAKRKAEKDADDKEDAETRKQYGSADALFGTDTVGKRRKEREKKRGEAAKASIKSYATPIIKNISKSTGVQDTLDKMQLAKARNRLQTGVGSYMDKMPFKGLSRK